MRYTIGWLRMRPGKRDEFMRVSKPVFDITRKEDGCLFYEVHPTTEDPNLVILIEGWQTIAQHEAHTKAPHHVGFGPTFVKLCAEARFDEIDATNIVTQTPKFT